MKIKNIILPVFSLVGIVLALYSFQKSNKLPSELVLAIPFTSQAPNGNWDRNEDCEETSVTMANAFLSGTQTKLLDADSAAASIKHLRDWENSNIGYNLNTGVDATEAMAKGGFGLKVEQINNYSADDLKKALVDNKVVLLSINARQLNNPKYLDNGPLYHMIVVRGWTDNGFVVNDPGTTEGNGNTYTFDVLKNAAADWNQNTKTMDPNRKIALILSK